MNQDYTDGETEYQFQPQLNQVTPDYNFSKWQLDSNDVLAEIEHRLRGQIFYNGEWLFPVEHTKPLMNEKGIGEILAYLSGIFDKKNILTYLSDSDIEPISQYLLTGLVNIITLNSGEWELNPKKADLIYDMLFTQIYLGVIKRGWQGKAMESISKTTQRIETVSTRMPEQKEKRPLSLSNVTGTIGGVFKR